MQTRIYSLAEMLERLDDMNEQITELEAAHKYGQAEKLSEASFALVMIIEAKYPGQFK